MITVNGVKYRVVENMGYQPSCGMYAKMVATPCGDRVAVKCWGGIWRWWLVDDRLQQRSQYRGQEAVSPQGEKDD
jgi:hypothetical protein